MVDLEFELEARNMRQSELSELTGLTRSTISDLCSGKKHYGLKSAIKISKVLGISLEEFFDEEEE